MAGDVRFSGRDSEPVPEVYLSNRQYDYVKPYAPLVVRTARDATSRIAEFKARIWVVDRDQPVMRMDTAESILAQSTASRRLFLMLLGAFAGIALLMATGLEWTRANIAEEPG